ncbi:hypothetical protein ACFO5O_04145 [Geojedonia litorea]|uniref:Uncharacterized protein n=1 Tax=Geojedonia litorea TaxID=1268269 RepID=A0ABV9MZU0_9FLAO
MKVILNFIVFMVMSNACNDKVTTNIPENLIQENTNLQVSYKATTRGFYEKVWITKDSIYMTNDRNSQHVISQAINVDFWNELLALVHKTDLQQLEKLEPPTKMYQVDGAAMATIEVATNHEVFKTKTFDHGHPPKAISVLVNKVLSVKEILAKQ